MARGDPTPPGHQRVGRVGEREDHVSESWISQGSSGAPLDVSEVLDAAVGDAITAVVAAGALLSLGVSSDGGALAATVTVDGEYRREWFRDGEALAEFLRGGAEYAGSLRREPASLARRNGSRGRSKR